jgi:DNA-binding transcriptional MerR regulator
VNLYNATQAASIAGLWPSQLSRLIKLGLVVAFHQSPGGRPLFTDQDIALIHAAADEWKKQSKEMRLQTRMERASKLAELYKTTSTTYEAIGIQEGITRERVRQLLKMVGVSRKDKLSKSAARATQKAARLERHCIHSYGCGWNDVRRITGRDKFQFLRKHPLIKLYWHHRNHANRTKIGWGFTLPEYAEIVGPHLEKFGLRRDSMVLGRKDKSLPFSKDNCEVVTLQANSRATNGFAAAHGFVTARKIDRIRKVLAMQGEGLSQQEIAERLGVSRATISSDLSVAKNVQI